MGSLCSKETEVIDYVIDNKKHNGERNSSVHVVTAPPKREKFVAVVAKPTNALSANSISKQSGEPNAGVVPASRLEGSVGKTVIIERPTQCHRRSSTIDIGVGGCRGQESLSTILSSHFGPVGEHSAGGWPIWLSSVAGEAIQGWLPRSADSYEKIDKIGQGTYSSVYRALDLTTNKVVAMKKVKFVNMDPESVRFMAKEISILRRLDHPNVMKLEALATSRITGSLYLIFEYMEHDLAGLLASPKVKFTEPQIKCYMQQLLHGLEHCHSRGVLHRDIKGSNLLVDNYGNLKIGDWGLATTYEPNQEEPLTSRVVTLWYRAPELLLGATAYGPAIDMWSAGCILAELYMGKPILPGRTEVEQMHKIFKLCGSPSEEYWRDSKLPHATSFKPHQPYMRHVTDTFKELPPAALNLVDDLLSIEPNQRSDATSALNSEFFNTKPLPCDPSALPTYPPSKELDAKMREEERRQKAESVKGNDKELRTKSSGSSMVTAFDEKQGPSNKSTGVKFIPTEESGTAFPIEPSRVALRKGLPHATSAVHPNAVGYQWASKAKHDSGSSVHGRALGSSLHGGEFTRQGSQKHHGTRETSRRDGIESEQDSSVYVPRRNRLQFSGPLMRPGGNMEEMLNEHEKQIQEAVRKARLDKIKTKKNLLSLLGGPEPEPAFYIG
ncbi:non-receptor serine/threonine protein kinase [Lithospermum erythrorhizon]|uniref:Non-receptor serine/threonine protein kinase n=1 Tax=Lithospermum erythrorhizon TaxID=34254 RepID=A0AAV3P1Z5_LITER